MGNKIIEKVFLKGNIKLVSPILIGNGIEENTDNDILRDSEGKVFIPGTSIAGSVRSYLTSRYKNNEEMLSLVDKYMGYSNGDKGSQSCICFYDGEEIKKGTVSVRDGIALEEFLKITKDTAKYNYEVAERDYAFSFKLELTVRKSYEEYLEKFHEITRIILKAIQDGRIRLGAKTNRGLGKVRLEKLQGVKFDFTNKHSLKEFVEFSWDKDFEEEKSSNYIEGMKFVDLLDVEIKDDNLTKIQIPLKLKNTLFIRNYMLATDDVDAEQIKFDDRFIIPGTTWNGAFRHRMFIILYELFSGEKKNEILNKLFGEKGDNKKDEGHMSRIIFEESIAKEKGEFLEIRRTKIDRFTGGACDRGLFESRVAVNGETELNIWIKDAKDYEIGLVLMCIYDLIGGFLAIGGETSIGRGILSSNDELKILKEHIKLNDISLTEEVSKTYLKAVKAEVV